VGEGGGEGEGERGEQVMMTGFGEG
jgi:hypothetical protein